MIREMRVSRYHFFIAYASPDWRQARKLYFHLQEELRDEPDKVFFDRHQIQPGDTWPVRLSEALASSRAVVVLISSHTRAAFYEQEEIARAIQRARQQPGRHTIIPVLLETLPEGLPYGMSSLQVLDATRPSGLERVAVELVDWLAQQDAPEEKLSHHSLSRANYQALGAASRLDRYPHWSRVLEENQRPGHVLFLLHGPRHQNVGLFVERIQRFLSREVETPHRVYRVPFSWEGITARCGADWLRHLRWTLGGSGQASRLLQEAAREQAVFIILGLRPLDPHQFDEVQLTGLQELLEHELPSLLGEARPAHDVQVLLALDYDRESDPIPPLIRQIDAWGRRAEQAGGLRYRPLRPVKMPTWEEVHDYIADHHSHTQDGTIDALKAEYQRLTSGRQFSYQELADVIDRYLQDA